ncbi:MAG: hydrogenase iron-sulfur subunit [Deltaproteobacteria bacterium]|nr:hydrogenase iron-sulfur subunit [Deltaproteobacteria bacterium]MBW2072235.1 hydrogenase iron-sulfur subunit [Deltaproteobacteria bacterium]
MEGNYYARRKFALFKNLIEYMGIEPGRLHFSWISSAEAGKFVQVVEEISEQVRQCGPARRLIKTIPEVA